MAPRSVVEEGDGTPSFRPLWTLMPYLWPKGRPDLRARVIISIVFLVFATAFTSVSPLIFGWAVDRLKPTPANIAIGTVLALIAAYAISRILMQAFAQLREVCDELRQDTAQAPFVLGCPVSLLARWMIPRLERLMAELPELALHLRPQEAPFDDALTGLDAAVLAGEPPWPAAWQVHPLARERVGPVVSPSFAQAHALAGSDPQVLPELPLLHTLSRPQAWSSWAQSTGLSTHELPLGQGYPHLYHLIEAAVAGRGVAIAPLQLVADDLASGRLLAPWGFQDIAAQWVLATPSRAPIERSAALAAWLRAEFAKPQH